MSKKLISAVAAASLGAVALSSTAMAGVSGTAGVVSNYVFRGVELGGAAANASIDYSHDSGFAIGIWAIDNAGGSSTYVVDTDDASTFVELDSPSDGQEFDIYASYGQENDNFSWSIGVTTYQYTQGTGSENELNLGLGMGKFSLAVDIGKHEDSVNTDIDVDMTHYALSYAHNDNWTFTLGQVDPNTEDDAVAANDFTSGEDDGWTYLDATVAGSVSDVDVALSVGAVDEEDMASNMAGYMVLSVSKTFDGLGL